MTSLPLTVLKQTSLTITVGWTPPAGAVGYEFLRDGKRVSSSFDGAKSQVSFGIPDANEHTYEVMAVGAVAAGTVTVNAPAPPPPPPPSASRVPFAPDDPINTKLPTHLVKDPNSDAWMATVRAAASSGFATNISTFTASVNRMSEIGGWSMQKVYGWNKAVSITGPVSASMAIDQSSDGMCVVIDDRDPDPANWWVYNYLTSGLARNSDGSINTYGLGKWRYTGHPWWETRPSAGNVPGKGFPITTGHMNGLCSLAGLISPDDLKAGVIAHALAIALPGGGHRGLRSPAPYNTVGVSGTAPDVGYRFPATRSDGSGGVSAPPGGCRYRLDPAFDIKAYTSDTAKRMVLKAMQDYGMFDSDTIGAPVFGMCVWNTNSPSKPVYPSSLRGPWGADLLPHIHIVPVQPFDASVLVTPALAGGFA